MNITVPMGKQQQQQPLPPPPPPPTDFPEPFAPYYEPGEYAYRQPGPQSGNTPQIPSSSHAIPTRPQPSLPPPVPQSTHPRPSDRPPVRPPGPPERNSTHPQFNAPSPALAPTPTRRLAPVYEHGSSPHSTQSLSRPSSRNPSFPVPVTERHPPTDPSVSPSTMMQRSTTIPIPNIPSMATSGPYCDSSPPSDMYQPLVDRRQDQRSTSILIPGNPNTAPPIPYYESSPPSSVHPPSESHSEMSGGAQPIERSWSYLEVHERGYVSSSDEEELESREGTSSSSGYMQGKGPPKRPFATSRIKPTRRETVPANTNQAPPPPLVMSRSGGPQPGVDRSWRYPDVQGREGVSMRENRPEGTGSYLQPPIPPFAARGPPNLGGTTPESPPANLSCRLCGRMSPRGELVRLGGFCSEEDKWQWERNHHGWG